MTNVIRLRSINFNDTAFIIKWRNSPSVKLNLYSQEELTESQHLWWLENKVKTGECKQFVIEEASSENSSKPIGTTFLKNIDEKNKKAEFGIFIGEEDARGKGYAAIATKQTLNFAFSILKLNRVYLTVFYDNIAAIKAYENAGFIKEGLLIEDIWRKSEYCNIIYMGITFSRWNLINSSNS